MPIKDEKQKIFGKIAALRTLNDNYPELKLSNSFPSITNSDKVIDFLIDLMKSLVGQEEFKNIIINFLTYKLDNLETKIKNALKDKLTNNITNGTDPSIPSFLINGFDINIPEIDFFDMLQIDPLSSVGSLIYNDEKAGLASKDFNTFLFETLQSTDVTQKWGSQTGANDIFEITFKDKKKLNIKITNDYIDKTLSVLNNDFIDSLNLINSDKVVSKLIDGLYGSIATLIKKTQESIIIESKVDAIIDRFIDLDDEKIIDDSFFEFSNEQIRVIEEKSNDRCNGIRKLIDCNNYESSVDFNILSGVTTEIKNASTLTGKKDAITKGINTLMNEVNFNASDIDKHNVDLNFLTEIIKEISKTLVKAIMSPSIILVMAINSKIFEKIDPPKVNIPNVNIPHVNMPNANAPEPPQPNTNGSTPPPPNTNEKSENTIEKGEKKIKNATDFLKDNSQIFKDIIGLIKDDFISELLSKIVKTITQLRNATLSELAIESARYALLSILSLISVPQDVLEKIRGL